VVSGLFPLARGIYFPDMAFVMSTAATTTKQLMAQLLAGISSR